MTTRMRSWIALSLVVAALPVLQGAGCSAHHTPRLRGQIDTPEALLYAHAGHKLLLVYRPHAPCDDWAACLLSGDWQRLEACKGPLEDGGGDLAEIVVTEGVTSSRFDACTAMLGVDYAVDLAAFIDLDENGAPSAGEPFGVYQAGPLRRDGEDAPVVIRVDGRLP